ncbi:MAG: ribosomal protein S5, nonfunctional [Parcubacteria group bacterium GW2011_GWA1_47_11]|nr:MAG: ribosomal protein S5, nonfunctional [Parcubacteria group bacterium GW2011_GWA1_47_11]
MEEGRKNRRGGRDSRRPIRENRVQEFQEQVIDLRRVTRVMSGGKRFRFRATVLLGNGKGKVGVGVAKGLDVESSIAKAKAKAKRNMIEIKLNEGSILHEVEAKFSAARVLIKPAPAGHGLMAGGSPRLVLKLAGIQNVTAKCLGSTSNKLTNALATIEALKSLRVSK